MPTARNKYSIFFQAMLLTVYAAFFAVQLFYNFEGYNNPHTYRHTHSITASIKTGTTIQAGNGGHPLGSHILRLNKRFQQEEMPPCVISSIPAPEKYLPLKDAGSYKNVFLLSVFPTNRPLRGPPPVIS